MKEIYFTNKNIDTKARKMLQQLKKYRNEHMLKFELKQSALLIIDMQKYFLDERSHAFLPSALPIIPKIKTLRDAFLKKNLPIIFTQHINNKKNAKMLKEWWQDIITKDNPLNQIIPDLLYPNATVIKKTQYDAFYRTTLDEILRKKNIRQIIMTGVMTNLCCESTARAAFVRGFKVFFAINGTATQNEDFHRASLLNLSHGFAIPVLTKEIIKWLNT